MKFTYKPYETEEYLDFYFFRPIASFLIRIIRNTSVMPDHLTLICLCFGLLASYFIAFSSSVYMRIVAGILLALVGVFDCADGQLARFRGINSVFGRIFDGFVDYLVFAFIYCAIFLNLYYDGYPLGNSYVFYLVFFASVVSHVAHSVLFDYYRNRYLKFTSFDYKVEGSSMEGVKIELRDAFALNPNFFKRFLLKIYYFYSYFQFYYSADSRDNQLVDGEDYVKFNKLILRFWSFLGTSIHLFYIILAVIFDVLYLYLYFEVIFLNIYMFFVMFFQFRVDAKLFR